MRICSLFPGATEIVYALGLGEHVVGVTHECDFPPETRDKKIVVRSVVDPEAMTSAQIDAKVRQIQRSATNLYTIDIDAFSEARPEVVLIQDLCDVCAIDRRQVAEACQSLPYEPIIVALAPSCVSDVLADIERVGAATGTEKPAQVLVQRLRDRIGRVSERSAQARSRPRVACLEWLEPIYFAGHWIPEMVELAGGRNGFGETRQPSAKLEWRALWEFSPEIILLMPCGFEPERTERESQLLHRLDGWSELPAVKSGRVFAVNGHAFFSRPGPRLIDGLELLAQLIHPDIFGLPVSPHAARRLH